MGAAINGMTLYGPLRVHGSTFLIFSDYMRPAIRLAALMKIPSIFVYTHDSSFSAKTVRRINRSSSFSRSA